MKSESKCEECRKKTKELFEKITSESAKWVCKDCADPRNFTTGSERRILDETKRKRGPV